MRITKHFKNFLTAIFIAVYAFAVSPAEYLHHHFLHSQNAGNSLQYSKENGKIFKKAFSSCDTKCPVCHHKLWGEGGIGKIDTAAFSLTKITGKIFSSPGFLFSNTLFSLADRGPPVYDNF
ncbi:hypothetical protein SAMN05444360_106121 [Chryseobacterium carnipullorum]|uniref:hypothetical protein n=1 Tax=Chryseobacterium carnipullorum TaxID=1124835 RepID=UPI00091BC814|nr:hypothetical protein [Chryseobacterium carnipullorum]SHL95664.1 hypothetical protein SAMN05444360_106121 [Chryseobacterium carnipullorum]